MLEESGPRYSDDGRFYWDGQHWVSVQSQTPAPVGVVATNAEVLTLRFGK